MHKIILSAFLAFAFMLSSCGGYDYPSNVVANRPSVSEKAAVHEKLDFSQTWYNPCCEEEILVSGTVHYATKDGVAHGSLSNVVAIDAHGNTYHGGGISTETWNSDPGAVTGTMQYRVNFVSAAGCSFRTVLTYHFTYDANGNLVVDNQTAEFSCEHDCSHH